MVLGTAMFRLKQQDPRQRELLTRFPTNPEVLKRMQRAFQLAGRNDIVLKCKQDTNSGESREPI
jgi:adenylate kinase family enzyme